LTPEEIHHAWYYGYVANFWLNNRNKCYDILKEYYSLCQKEENVANYVRGLRGFILDMIQYMDSPELTQLFESI
jgi:hypothetical protein